MYLFGRIRREAIRYARDACAFLFLDPRWGPARSPASPSFAFISFQRPISFSSFVLALTRWSKAVRFTPRFVFRNVPVALEGNNTRRFVRCGRWRRPRWHHPIFVPRRLRHLRRVSIRLIVRLIPHSDIRTSAYTIPVNIGGDPRTYWLQVDTGSSDLVRILPFLSLLCCDIYICMSLCRSGSLPRPVPPRAVAPLEATIYMTHPTQRQQAMNLIFHTLKDLSPAPSFGIK